MNEIQDLSPRLEFGEVRFYVEPDLIDQPVDAVIETLQNLGYAPQACRHTWRTNELVTASTSSVVLMLRHTRPPIDGVQLFEELDQDWVKLDAVFQDAVTLVRAAGKLGHTLQPPRRRTFLIESDLF